MSNQRKPQSKSNHLERLVMSFRDGILDGKTSTDMCFAVCSPLVAFLHWQEAIECELSSGVLEFDGEEYEHFWITMPDGSIIDPTADQFKTPDGSDMPPIFTGEKPEWYSTT